MRGRRTVKVSLSIDDYWRLALYSGIDKFTLQGIIENLIIRYIRLRKRQGSGRLAGQGVKKWTKK